ncbi:hypothetical protein N9Y14_00530 [Alphaproteobacteria bacterium]|nr:hypothetical protein [Alphaproteobacteria bacterium]MDB2406718.1 hypothetical protein [Alphaproteobacteria bacterium]MDB2540616.1 hypothetical protein [Alphaproteobacteria bacterium]MDB2649025.1 hypothetical protein [Alphaproteobacteria bacterium]
MIDDTNVSGSINFVIDAEVEQPTNNSLKSTGCIEHIKWSRNLNESNFFVTATQFIYTRHLLQMVKSIHHYDYVIKIRPDVIFFNEESLANKVSQIVTLGERRLYVAKNPHCHPSKQVSDHFFLSKFDVFDAVWPQSLNYNLLFNLSKYNPERFLRLRSLMSREATEVICERYIDYWNYDNKPRSYDPILFQNISLKNMKYPHEIKNYIKKYA